MEGNLFLLDEVGLAEAGMEIRVCKTATREESEELVKLSLVSLSNNILGLGKGGQWLTLRDKGPD